MIHSPNYKQRYFIHLSIFLLCLCIFAGKTHAQISSDAFGYFNDAIRFSRPTSAFGTARFQSLGGAQTALGGDLSSLAGNPAGLGVYRRSEVGISPAFLYANTESDYFVPSDQTTTTDNKFNFNINQFGIVFANLKNPGDEGKFRGGSFGVSLSRINNFQNRFAYDGINRSTSKTDFYVDITNGVSVSELEDGNLGQFEFQRAAYFAFLTNPLFVIVDGDGNEIVDPDNRDYFTFARNANEELLGDIRQREVVNTDGAQYQWNLAYGGNFDDRLFFGFGIDIETINFDQESTYEEEVIEDPNAPELSFLESFRETSTLQVRGTGVGASLGLIYKANDFVRVGFSAHSPTFYFLREEFSTLFESRIFDFNNQIEIFEESTLPGDFNYNLRTPWRVNLGGAFFIGKSGFISVDAEYVDYTSMDVSAQDDPLLLEGDNETIDNIFKPVWNFRAGGEYRYNIFRGRVGLAYESDPYDDIDDIDRAIIRASGGIGIRTREWYVDVGITHTRFNSAYTPYTLSAGSPFAGLEPFAEVKNRITQVVFSGGIFF